jgi:endonuclease I
MPSPVHRPYRTHPAKGSGWNAAALARLVAVSLISFSLTPVSLEAAAPPGYYNTVVIDTPAQLRTTLHNVIKNHTRYPYTSSGTDTWTILETADQDPANSTHILDLYRNRSLVKFGGGTGPYNREHTWPNSYGFPDDGVTNYPYTDCHHLFLCDVSYNSDRANKPYGAAVPGSTERVTDFNDGQGGGSGVFPGNSNWFTATIWQTWNGRKGDVARAMFYMDVRYEGGTHGITGAAEPDLILTDNINQIVTTGTNASVAYMGLLSVLVKWNAEDPPDSRERAHTDAVYSFQGNRNPFVDHPEWVNALFVPSTGPTIVSIQDVPADQGGYLDVNWQRNSLDVAGSAWPIDHYTVQRFSGIWLDVGTLPANTSASYTMTVPTSDISTPGNPQPFSQYRVEAVEPGGTIRLSGTTGAYSVDNLAPPTPVVALDQSGVPVVISWGAPAIPDFNTACVYRGDASGFVPGAALACTTGTNYLEYDSPPHYYVVQFSDTHGNLSPFSAEVSTTVSGVPDGGNGRPTAITQVSPNPFGQRTNIAFSLSEPGSIHIDLFAADGRLVRSLLNEARGVGAFQVFWDGTNDQGRPMANGPYFVRLSSNGRVDSRKVLLVR